MPNNPNSILSFSKDQSEVKFIRYLFKFGYVGIAFVIFLIIFDDSISQSFDSWPFMIIFICCVIIAHLFLSQFIKRLDLNMCDKQIVFHRYLTDKRIEVNFSNIHYIRVGFYIKFAYSGGTIRFNEARNKDLINILKEYFVIHRSPAANILKIFEK